MCKERYINPFTDFGFKKLFGDEESLKSILNSIIDDGDPIVSLTYMPTEKLGMIQHSRVAVFDLYCHTESGAHIIVEMQNNAQDFFVDRSIYYSSFPIQEAAKKGKWDYSLPKIYTVAFLNFNIWEFEDSHDARNVVRLANTATGRVFYDKLTYIYIELPKFRKRMEELESKFEWWLYILKNLNNFDEPPHQLIDEVMRTFLENADIKRFTKDEIYAYEESLKALRDYENVLESARRKAEREGMAKGMEEGMAKGMEEGMAKGMAKGEERERKESIRFMLSLGITPQVIADKYGVSADEVIRLSES